MQVHVSQGLATVHANLAAWLTVCLARSSGHSAGPTRAGQPKVLPGHKRKPPSLGRGSHILAMHPAGFERATSVVCRQSPH